MSTTSLKQAYKYYNKIYFNNKLPSNCKVVFRTNKQLRKYSKYSPDGAHLIVWRYYSNKPKQIIRHEIWILDRIRQGSYILIVLLHEMAHLHLSIKGLHHINHGPHFRKEQRRLIKAGAYDDLL